MYTLLVKDSVNKIQNDKKASRNNNLVRHRSFFPAVPKGPIENTIIHFTKLLTKHS